MQPSEIGWFLFVPWMVRTLAVFAVLPLLLHAVRAVYIRSGYAPELAVFKAHVFAVRCGALVATVFMATFGAAQNNLQLFALASAGGMDALWDVACRVLFTDIAISIGVGSGEVLGIVGFLQTVLSVFAPLIFQSVYSGTVTIYDGGFVFVVTGSITFIGFLLTWGLPAPPAGNTAATRGGGGGGGRSGSSTSTDGSRIEGAAHIGNAGVAIGAINAGGDGERRGAAGGVGKRGSSSSSRRPHTSPPPSYLAGEEGSQAARPLLQAYE